MLVKVNTKRKVIAFTFDDGPNPIYTPQLLKLFEQAGGKATFFMIGQQMEKYPGIVKAVIENGHEIGNHTYSHPNLVTLPAENSYEELQKNDLLIKNMTGERPKTFRPPFLTYNEQIEALNNRFGYTMTGALNLNARDWEQPGVEHILMETSMHVNAGSILLFHDGFGNRSQTIEAVKILIHELINQDYKFITISEMVKLQP